MGVFHLKERDTLPVLEVALKNPDGSAADITGSTAWKLHILLSDGSGFTRNMVPFSLSPAVLRYAWVDFDWDPSNPDGYLVQGPDLPPPKGTLEHRMEYEVLSGVDGLTFPNDGYDTLRVWSDLEADPAIPSEPPAVIGPSLMSDPTQHPTTVLTQEILNTCSVPANFFSQNGKALRISAFFKTAANANSKIALLFFGSTQVVAIGGTFNNTSYLLQATVVRTGTNAQKCLSEENRAGGTNGGIGMALATEVDTAPIQITAQGLTATAAGDMTLEYLRVEVIPWLL